MMNFIYSILNFISHFNFFNMSDTNNCVILPSIDCLPLTQLYINFFQEQEEKAKQLFRSVDTIYHPIVSQEHQTELSCNSNNIYQNNIVGLKQMQCSTPIIMNSVYTNKQANYQQQMISKLKGSWSLEEDNKLRDAVANCDPILWDVVAEKVPGRSAIQCKERWLYRLHPEVKKTRFEKWEDDLIIKERNRVGNHWTLISNKLPGRTSCAVKNRWYSVLRNRIKSNDSFPF